MEHVLNEDPDEVEHVLDQFYPFRLFLRASFFIFLLLFFINFPGKRETRKSIVKINGESDLIAMHDQYFLPPTAEEKPKAFLPLDSASVEKIERDPFYAHAYNHFKVSKHLHVYIASISMLLPPSSSASTTVSGLSASEEEEVLSALRFAILYGSPWLVLTGSSSASSRASLDYILHSPDVPHRLFTEEVLSRITDYMDPTTLSEKKGEKLMKLAGDLHHFFKAFSTTLGSWMKGKKKIQGWYIPYAVEAHLEKLNVWDARVEVWKRIVEDVYNGGSDGDNPADEYREDDGNKESRILSSSFSVSSYVDDVSTAFGDGLSHMPHPLHEFARVEEVPRMVILHKDVCLILPGIITLTHSDVYHRLDLVAETLATIMTSRILRGVLLRKNEVSRQNRTAIEHRDSSKYQGVSHTANASKRLSSPFSKKKWAVYRPGVILSFPSSNGETVSETFSDFSILIDSFFSHALQISLGNSILLESTALPVLFPNSTEPLRMTNPIVDLTSQAKDLIFVTTKPKTVSNGCLRLFFFSPFKLFRRLRREIVYHFSMVEASLIHFPRKSSIFFRLAHYFVYLFRRFEFSLYGYSFFFQLLNWVYRIDRRNFSILDASKTLYNYSFF